VYPGLALAEALGSTEEAPEILFVGTKSGLESKVVPEANYNFKSVEVRGFTRKLSFDLPKAFILLLRGIVKSLKIVKDFQPDVVVGLGGYVSAPIVLASVLKGIPILLHEQNTTPGLANRLLAKRADMVAVSYPSSEKYFSSAKHVCLTGNPVREEIVESCKKEYKEFGLDPTRKTILIFGGSRGAQRINKAAIEAYPLFRSFEDLQIIHSAGMMNFEYVTDTLKKLQSRSDKIIYRCYSYLDQINLAYSVSDLVICRAGATTLAEITALGKAAILIPYPYATNDHQRRNAEILEDAGASSVIADEALNGTMLFEEATRIVFDDNLVKKMSKAARNLGKPDAAKKIAQLVIEIAKSKK
jgi:UDP-N-acetylglucosamine--N-acetylmuramyl-(pentapeptide) pyrophosphoryl-undecaprenol N-acetylglucosamine transferase